MKKADKIRTFAAPYGSCKSTMDIDPAVGYLYRDLYFAGFAACPCDPRTAYQEQWVCYFYIYSSDVDEFFAANDRLAVIAGKDRRDQSGAALDRSATAEHDQYTGSGCPWHGI